MRTVITLNALWRDVKALYTGEARFRKTVAAERPHTVSSGSVSQINYSDLPCRFEGFIALVQIGGVHK